MVGHFCVGKPPIKLTKLSIKQGNREFVGQVRLGYICYYNLMFKLFVRFELNQRPYYKRSMFFGHKKLIRKHFTQSLELITQ